MLTPSFLFDLGQYHVRHILHHLATVLSVADRLVSIYHLRSRIGSIKSCCCCHFIAVMVLWGLIWKRTINYAIKNSLTFCYSIDKNKSSLRLVAFSLCFNFTVYLQTQRSKWWQLTERSGVSGSGWKDTKWVWKSLQFRPDSVSVFEYFLL